MTDFDACERRALDPVLQGLHLTGEPRRSPGALKVLVVDDEESVREALANVVRSLGHSCFVAADGLEACRIQKDDPAHVILSDWNMPRMSGVELCRRVREAPGNYTQFILVTALDDKESFLEGMRAGADDYLAKPVDVDELDVRLRAVCRVALAQRDLEDNNRALRGVSERALADARTDPLTQAGNRLRLREDLLGIVERARRYGNRCCAALCDIDWFKSYNDVFGHLAGDNALRVIARTIQGQLRQGDGFYRYGGEEFLVLLPEQSLTGSIECMERARRSVAAIPVAARGGLLGRPLTISVGIAELTVQGEGDSVSSWLHRADAALYRAKDGGRNRIDVGPSHPG